LFRGRGGAARRAAKKKLSENTGGAAVSNRNVLPLPPKEEEEEIDVEVMFGELITILDSAPEKAKLVHAHHPLLLESGL